MFSDTSSFSQESPARRENGSRQSNNNALFSFANPHHSSPKALHTPISRRDYSKKLEENQGKQGAFCHFLPCFPGKCPARVAILPNSDNFCRVVKVPFAVLRSMVGNSHSTQRGQSHNTALRHLRKTHYFIPMLPTRAQKVRIFANKDNNITSHIPHNISTKRLWQNGLNAR